MLYLGFEIGFQRSLSLRMNHPAIVVHYHELWLKGRNRKFYLRKLTTALRAALGGLPRFPWSKPAIA